MGESINAKNHKNSLIRDVAIISLSIAVAIILVKTGAILKVLASSQSLKLFGSFVAGAFFTSVFTAAPATVTLGEIALVNSVFWTAFFGAIGALIGDLIIFRFTRDIFSEHIIDFMRHRDKGRIFRALHKLKFLKWLTLFVAGIIIASPLPDELGIALLGFSKMRLYLFIPFSFTFNFIGISIVGIVARSLL